MSTGYLEDRWLLKLIQRLFDYADSNLLHQ